MLDQELLDRHRALKRRPTLRVEMCAAAEAAVVTVEVATEKEQWFPAPPLPLRRPRPGPSRLEQPSDDEHALAGCDADGQPVLVRSALRWGDGRHAPVVRDADEDDDQLVHVRILHGDGHRLEVIGCLTPDSVSRVTWIDHDEHGRQTRWATAASSATTGPRAAA